MAGADGEPADVGREREMVARARPQATGVAAAVSCTAAKAPVPGPRPAKLEGARDYAATGKGAGPKAQPSEDHRRTSNQGHH
jgi:hypothetical protein